MIPRMLLNPRKLSICPEVGSIKYNRHCVFRSSTTKKCSFWKLVTTFVNTITYKHTKSCGPRQAILSRRSNIDTKPNYLHNSKSIFERYFKYTLSRRKIKQWIWTVSSWDPSPWGAVAAATVQRRYKTDTRKHKGLYVSISRWSWLGLG